MSTRPALDVLLLDAENRQTLAAMRAYARTGLRVGAVACVSDAWWAPSFKSRWQSMTAAVPDFHTNASYQVGRRLHWVAGDIWNLKCAFESTGHPDLPPPMSALVRFLLDLARTSCALDDLELNDLRPGWAEMDKIVVRHTVARILHILTVRRRSVSER